jgi:16S rRNA (adenine1518-N6/adenine1519-N6)-dimethyltransferase
MIQKEVAERLASGPGSKTYGILSVLLQAYYRVEFLFTVNETVFIPPPKVKSAVIRLTRNDRDKLECDEALFFKVVKTAFNQRRKTLRNSLKTFYIDYERGEVGHLAGKRAEELGVEDFVRLTRLAI